MYSVIIPVYNRLENVKFALHALTLQKNAPEYELIIVDDGSTDGTQQWIESGTLPFNVYSCGQIITLRQEFRSKPTVRYLSGGPNKGFRGGRVRNIGAFNANPTSTRFIFIDSDVVLNEDALYHYAEADKVHPNAIIVGMYHWLNFLKWDLDGITKLVSYHTDNIDHLPDDLGVERINHINEGLYGFDLRMKDFTNNIHNLSRGNGLGAFSGNIGYPKELFYKLGGFDELICGHGGEDADVGLSADSLQADWLLYRPIFGWHLCHSRNQERNAKEVQANIQYIDFKHSVGTYKNAKKWVDAQDWSIAGHYHKHLGTVIARTTNNPTIFALREGKKLGISTPEWLVKLGFSWDDVKVVPDEELESYALMGTTEGQ